MNFICTPSRLFTPFYFFPSCPYTAQHVMASSDKPSSSSVEDPYEVMLRTWFKEKTWTGPGSTLPVCPKCHRVKYERRWAKEIRNILNPTVKHVCRAPCTSYTTCPTQRKDLHPEVQQKEKEEKASHQLSTSSIKSWETYEKWFSQTATKQDESTPTIPSYLETQMAALKGYSKAMNPKRTYQKAKKAGMCRT